MSRRATSKIVAVLLVLSGCDTPAATTTQSAAPATAAPTSTQIPRSGTTTPVPSASIPMPGLPADKIAAQHILISWRGARRSGGATRSKPEAKTLADEVLKKVKAGGDFSELATQYSDDKGSKDRQGSVGSFRREDMDPKFSEVAFGLAVGATSDLVETEFGFHIIKRNQ
jgi:peptidyl-prolyl cis-trans isomerase NIMA-interacting 1